MKEIRVGLSELGPQLARFSPDVANFVAGLILGVLAGTGGIAVFVWLIHFIVRHGGRLEWFKVRDKDDLSWALVGLAVLGGLVLLTFSFDFFRQARRIRFFDLIICRDGFVAVERGKVAVFPWNELACIMETVKQEYFPLKMGLKYLFPLKQSYSYLIRRNDGSEIHLDGNMVKQLAELRAILLNESRQRGIHWQTSHL